MLQENGSAINLAALQQERLLYPERNIEEDYRSIYIENNISVGWPDGATRIFDHLARENTIIITGSQLGDEGKGRIVDNKLGALLDIPGIDMAYVVRFQGGNNAGHTIESNDVKLALHQVPSGVMYPEAIGIMDSGMTIHPEDLQTEVTYVEKAVGDTRDKLILSPDAILCTDLERAEEVLNRKLQEKSGGGTGRGISSSYAHHYDRLGLHIKDLIDDNWRETLGNQYNRYSKLMHTYDLDLDTMNVPDFAETKQTGKAQIRTVGSKEEFLDRLEDSRSWLLDRNIVQNTFTIHQEALENMSRGVLFEGAQAIGLHPWLGTRPDVTSSDTSIYGIHASTKLWQTHNIADRLGVFKITYMSSVGARTMPTEANSQYEDKVRELAHEYGTTTGRPRDIAYLDLPFLSYNARMGGIEVLAGTHLDIGWENEPIRVCTHYTDSDGNVTPYQPGLSYQESVAPHYIELPGWDGEATQQAQTFDELPENAQKFLSFIQRRTGFPIVAATTGPDRDNIAKLPGYEV